MKADMKMKEGVMIVDGVRSHIHALRILANMGITDQKQARYSRRKRKLWIYLEGKRPGMVPGRCLARRIKEGEI